MKKLIQTFFCIALLVFALIFGMHVTFHRNEESDPFSITILPENSYYEKIENQAQEDPWHVFYNSEVGNQGFKIIDKNQNLTRQCDNGLFCVREGWSSELNFQGVPGEFHLTVKNNDVSLVFWHSKVTEDGPEVGYMMQLKNKNISLTNLATKEEIPLRNSVLNNDTVDIKVYATMLDRPYYCHRSKYNNKNGGYVFEEAKTVYKFVIDDKILCSFVSATLCGSLDLFHGDFSEIKYRGVYGEPDGVFMMRWFPIYDNSDMWP